MPVIASKVFELFFLRYYILERDSPLKPGRHLSRKDRKHVFANTCLKLLRMPWYSHSCNEQRYSYFTQSLQPEI